MVQFEQILKEVTDVLTALGYTYTIEQGKKLKSLYLININCPNGQDTLLQRHKDMIMMLTKGYFTGFDYFDGKYILSLFARMDGSDPDDDSYSCILKEIAEIPHYKSKSYPEFFINYIDKCVHITDMNEVLNIIIEELDKQYSDNKLSLKINAADDLYNMFINEN